MTKIHEYFSLTLLAALVLCLAGCAKPLEKQPITRICTPRTQPEQLIKTAAQTLTDMQFRIEKADPDAGYIRTHPLTAPQFFQFWRDDNVGPDNAFYANIHSVRRTAEISLTTENNKTCLTCRILTERLNLPEVSFTGRSRAAAMLARGAGTEQKLTLHTEQIHGVEWVKVGEDPQLAARILYRIKNKLKQPTQ